MGLPQHSVSMTRNSDERQRDSVRTRLVIRPAAAAPRGPLEESDHHRMHVTDDDESPGTDPQGTQLLNALAT